MVRMTGLEPAWLPKLAPEASASANSATSAYQLAFVILHYCSLKCKYKAIIYTCLKN